MDKADKKLRRSDVYSVTNVTKMRDNIRNTIYKTSDVQKYIDLEIDDNVWGLDSEHIIEAITPLFCEAIKADYRVVYSSLHNLLRGPIIGVSDVYDVAWVMAGNFIKLRAGEPVEPFTHVTHEEWVPVFVYDYMRHWRFSRRGGSYCMKVLAGSPTAHTVREFFADDARSRSLEFLRHVFALPPWKACTYRDIVGMHTWVLLDPVKSQEKGYTCFSHIECTPSFKKGNGDLLRGRKTKCLLDPTNNNWDCHNCRIGIIDCAQATHATNYSVNRCSVCSKAGFFEKVTDKVCIACQERRRLHVGKERR